MSARSLCTLLAAVASATDIVDVSEHVRFLTGR